VNGLHGVIAVRLVVKVSRRRHARKVLLPQMVASNAKETSSKQSHALQIHVQWIATSRIGWKFCLAQCHVVEACGRRSAQSTSKHSLVERTVQLILSAIYLATLSLVLLIA
jgi:hypothetical protein